MKSVIRASALQPRPWPNGLGITRDIFVQNRDGTQFDWLISVADLAENAAFSHFDACDRIFTVIEGDRVTLTLRGQSPMLCQPFVPASFPGDAPTMCTLGHGPARALNLFVDRRSFNGHVIVRTIAASHAIQTSDKVVAVFCAGGTLEADGERLNTGDTIIGVTDTHVRAVGNCAIAIMIEIVKTPGAG